MKHLLPLIYFRLYIINHATTNAFPQSFLDRKEKYVVHVMKAKLILSLKASYQY